MHTSIYLIPAHNGDYIHTTRERANAAVRAGRLRLEGVDGDEGANTVTYYYYATVEEV